MLWCSQFFTLRIFFSFLTWSTCFNLITSWIARIFSAEYSLVFLSLHRQTRANVPEILIIFKLIKTARSFSKYRNWIFFYFPNMNGVPPSDSSVSLLIYLYLFMKNGIHLVSAKNAKNKIEASILRRKHSWLVGGGRTGRRTYFSHHALVVLWLSSVAVSGSYIWLYFISLAVAAQCGLVSPVPTVLREINSFYGHFQSGPSTGLSSTLSRIAAPFPSPTPNTNHLPFHFWSAIAGSASAVLRQACLSMEIAIHQQFSV